MAATKGEVVTLDQLLAMPDPVPMGPRHHPAPHGAVVVAVLTELEEHGRHPSAMTLSIDKEDNRLYGRIVLEGGDAKRDAQREALRLSRRETYTGIDEKAVQEILAKAGLAGAFAETITLRHANDRTMSLHLTAAAEFFICNNLAVGRSDGGHARRRHTGHQDWTDLASEMVDRVLYELPEMQTEMARLATTEVSDERAKAIFWDIMTMPRRPVAPRLLEKAAQTYFSARTEDVATRSALSLHQALTRQLRGLGERREAAASQIFMRLLGDQFAAIEPELPVVN